MPHSSLLLLAIPLSVLANAQTPLLQHAAPFNAVSDQARWLDRHHWFRSDGLLWEAANMHRLEWDAALANDAKSIVERCEMDSNDHSVGWNLHREQTDAKSTIDTTRLIENAMLQWGMTPLLDLIPRFTEKAVGVGISNHYAQIVWSEVTRIGCAYAVCSNQLIVGCRYGPTSATNDQSWYKPGVSCSQCTIESTRCQQRMCTSSAASDLTTLLAPEDQSAQVYRQYQVMLQKTSRDLPLDTLPNSTSNETSGSGSSSSSSAPTAIPTPSSIPSPTPTPLVPPSPAPTSPTNSSTSAPSPSPTNQTIKRPTQSPEPTSSPSLSVPPSPKPAVEPAPSPVATTSIEESAEPVVRIPILQPVPVLPDTRETELEDQAPSTAKDHDPTATEQSSTQIGLLRAAPSSLGSIAIIVGVVFGVAAILVMAVCALQTRSLRKTEEQVVDIF